MNWAFPIRNKGCINNMEKLNQIKEGLFLLFIFAVCVSIHLVFQTDSKTIEELPVREKIEVVDSNGRPGTCIKLADQIFRCTFH